MCLINSVFKPQYWTFALQMRKFAVWASKDMIQSTKHNKILGTGAITKEKKKEKANKITTEQP